MTKQARVHLSRFRDSLSLSILGADGTVYLDAQGARDLARQAQALARALARREPFAESPPPGAPVPAWASSSAIESPAVYLFRLGNGNDGNWPRYLVHLEPDQDSPWAFLRAAVANEYQARSRTRRHLLEVLEVDGDGGEYGVHATAYEGPDGESEMGAAWRTAELEYQDRAGVAFYQDRATSLYTPRQVLDGPAWRTYRAELEARP